MWTQIASLEEVSPRKKAKELDVDHICAGFSDFLWACTFIATCSYFLWKKNLLWLMIRKCLVKIGILEALVNSASSNPKSSTTVVALRNHQTSLGSSSLISHVSTRK